MGNARGGTRKRAGGRGEGPSKNEGPTAHFRSLPLAQPTPRWPQAATDMATLDLTTLFPGGAGRGVGG